MKAYIPRIASAALLALFLGCAEIPEELRAEANSDSETETYKYCVYHEWQECGQGYYSFHNCSEPSNYCPYSNGSNSNGGSCSGNAYYSSPNCPGYYDCPSGYGCDRCSGSAYYSNSNCGGYYDCPSGYGCDPCSGDAYYSSPNCGGYYTCPNGWGCYHYSYCVYHSWQGCDQGSYDSSNCGGEPMDYCPYSGPSVSYSTMYDSRDGRTYSTVQIGGQNWMAENLNYYINYNASGSACYDCFKYGRLYDWATAMDIDSSYNYSYYPPYAGNKGICPYGWHIPSDGEWEKLFSYVGGSSYLDTYGFAALPGGYGTSDGYFYDAGYNGYWWSASEYDSINAYYRYSYGWGAGSKTSMYSVRCLQD